MGVCFCQAAMGGLLPSQEISNGINSEPPLVHDTAWHLLSARRHHVRTLESLEPRIPAPEGVRPKKRVQKN